MTRKRARLHRHQKQRNRGSAPEPSGLLISRDELKEQSKITEEELTYSLQTHLLSNAKRLPGGGPHGEGAVFGFHKDLVAPASIIHQIREAGGSHELAALRLLVKRTPPPSAEWMKRAVALTIRHVLGVDMTVRRIKRAAADERNSAKRIAHRIEHPHLNSRLSIRAEDARRFAGINDSTRGLKESDLKEYKRAGFNTIRMLYGIPDPDASEPLPEMSVPTLHETIMGAPDDRVPKAFDVVRRFLIRYERELNALVQQIPNFKGLTEAQLIERFLPFPGMFPGIKLKDALLPLLMVWPLIEPTNSDVRALALLTGMLKEGDAWARELERDKEARLTVESVLTDLDNLPHSPDGELPAALLLPSPDERSMSAH